jgi:hypothetical protein
MAALSIAFDIIIVGALSLPWVLLVIHLFFSDDEHTLKKHLQWVKDQKEPALAGVLLFAMTYSLGTVVSRIAQDFFDDDDVYIHASHHLFRVGVTESSIRTNVFCNAFKDSDTSQLSDQTTGKHEQSKTSNSAPSDSTAAKHEKFKKNDPDCQYTGRWIVRTYNPDTHQPVTAPVTGERITAEWINKQQDLARDIFYAKEAAVLLQGTDPTERIRQFHDQIMVLRGAAFGGLVAFSLCLFWWSAQSLPGLGWAVSLFYALVGFIASFHHLSETPLTDPPYMEFTWLVLAAAGCYILWRHTRKGKRGRDKPGAHNGPKPISLSYIVLAAFLTIAASLGWWATQVLYDQQVIFSYQAMSDPAAKPATPSQK